MKQQGEFWLEKCKFAEKRSKNKVVLFEGCTQKSALFRIQDALEIWII